MNLKEKIDDIKESYSKIQEEYSNKYKEYLIEELERLGVYKVDVYSKSTGKRGVLNIIKENYGGNRLDGCFYSI